MISCASLLIPEMPREFPVDFIADACLTMYDTRVRAYLPTCQLALYSRHIMRDAA